MTDLSAEFKALSEYRPKNKVRFVTAAALFDGHDAAINIMRRIQQGMGAERLADFHARHAKKSPAMLKRLQQGGDRQPQCLEVPMEAARCCSLGQITNALFEVGGQYRRVM